MRRKRHICLKSLFRVTGQLPFKGECLQYLGKLEKALKCYKKALEIAPGRPYAYRMSAELLIRVKKYLEAEAALSELERVFPDYKYDDYPKALFPAVKGEKERSLELYKGGPPLSDNWKNYYALQIYALLGMKEEALEVLEESKPTEINGHYLYLINNPYLDNLRDDPRFMEMVRISKEKYDALVKYFEDL